jgi:hypothetical protein
VENFVNTLLFSTLKGAPIAVLMMAQPGATERDCVFVTAPHAQVETLKSDEGRALLPGKPTEYRCRYSTGRNGTEIVFENQLGWRFTVRLDRNEKGRWSGEKDGAKLSGQAASLTTLMREMSR